MSRWPLVATILVSLIVAAIAVPQQSPDRGDTGLYFSVGGGVVHHPELIGSKRLKGGKTVTLDPEDYHTQYSTYELGWSVAAAFGIHLADAMKAEAEFSYASAGVSELSGLDKDDFKELPRLAVMSIIANGLYELDTGGPLRPFIGLGIGPALASFSFGKLKTTADAGSTGVDLPEEIASGWGAAYQARLGVAYELFDGLSVQLGYRFFGMDTTILNYERKLDKDDPEYADFDTEIGSHYSPPLATHRVEVGLTYRLPAF